MTALPEVVVVHEKTVQAVAKDEVEVPKRRPRRNSHSRSSRVETVVIPEVWEEALALAQNPKWIQKVSSREVIVWNRPPPWPPYPPDRSTASTV